MTFFILKVEVFVLVMAVLYVLKTLYALGQIMYVKSGKLALNTVEKVLLSASISYIVTIATVGL